MPDEEKKPLERKVEKATEKEAPKERFMIGEVPTETAPVILDTENEDIAYNELTMLCLLANKLDALEKKL